MSHSYESCKYFYQNVYFAEECNFHDKYQVNIYNPMRNVCSLFILFVCYLLLVKTLVSAPTGLYFRFRNLSPLDTRVNRHII